ncbi:peptidase S41, partial [Streptomyces sp. MBRL 10]
MSHDVAYLRFPHLHDDLLCFATEDDLWVAPLVPDGQEPGRAWRVTVDRTRVGHPRFSPDGRHIAFTTWRSLDPEIHLAPVDGGPARQLSHWGATDTRVCGWDPDGNILAVSSREQPFSYFSWAYKLPTDGSPGGRLPGGPSPTSRSPTSTASTAACCSPANPRTSRRLEALPGRRHGPALAARAPARGGHRRTPRLRDVRRRPHRLPLRPRGIGNLYSCLPDGTDLRRHTDHDEFYARHASSDGSRVVYQCAGELWLVESLAPGAVPRRLRVRLGGPRAGRRTYQ